MLYKGMQIYQNFICITNNVAAVGTLGTRLELRNPRPPIALWEGRQSKRLIIFDCMVPCE